MATFWERVTGFGDGASEMLDLDALQAAVILYTNAGLISLQEMHSWLGLTNVQGAQLHAFIIAAQPGGAEERVIWTTSFRAVFVAARGGVAIVDTIEKVQAALNFVPEPEE